jgi:SAM-dependent methyltransferase
VTAVEGYDSSSYGDAFADVYDDWYHGISDVDATVATLASLSSANPSLPVVELGVGTGRLALPLAERIHPTEVIGIDSSAAMLDVLASKSGGRRVHVVRGDMITALPNGPLGLVFVAYNTFFNLASADLQRRCFAEVAARLAVDGCFVLEAFIPQDPPRTGHDIAVRTMASDRVVLSISRYAGEQQVAEGQFVEFTEAHGVRLRPWSIRYAQPAELDAMADDAGLFLRSRWQTFAGDVFDDDSPQHVSVYARRAP